jgi:CopG family transcriptional regulator, nickel-responsive regulator
MIRNVLIENELQDEHAQSVGTLTLVYNHHQRELEEKLTEYQHHHLNAIITGVHVHLTPHLRLEVLLPRGKAKEIKKVADGLIATKGVQHGKLAVTTVGRESH